MIRNNMKLLIQIKPVYQISWPSVKYYIYLIDSIFAIKNVIDS